MHKVLTLLFSFALIGSLSAQEKRASPLITVDENIDGLEVHIEYGQPSKKGRTVFGEDALVPFGKVWRTGANEATVIQFSDDVMIDGNKVKAGKYALFTIPGEKEWTIILNSVWSQWGAYNYDSSKDVLSFKVKAEKEKEVQEKFTITVSADGEVELSWDQTEVEFDIEKA